MAVCRCLFAVTTLALICLTAVWPQHQASGHIETLSGEPTHERKKLTDYTEDGDSRLPSLRRRRSGDQSETSTETVMNQNQSESNSKSILDQPQPRPTEPSSIQNAIDHIFSFSNPFVGGRSILATPKPMSKEVPKCAGGLTFCAGPVDDYPQSILDQLLNDGPDQWKAFNISDELSKDDRRIGERGPGDAEQLCDSKVAITYPTKAMTVEESWLFVVQRPDFVQGVRMEQCTNEHDSCSSQLTHGLSRAYCSQCKQKYIHRQLWAVKSDDTQPKLEQTLFMLPSCCSCVLTKRNSDGECDAANAEDGESKPRSGEGRPVGMTPGVGGGVAPTGVRSTRGCPNGTCSGRWWDNGHMLVSSDITPATDTRPGQKGEHDEHPRNSHPLSNDTSTPPSRASSGPCARVLLHVLLTMLETYIFHWR